MFILFTFNGPSCQALRRRPAHRGANPRATRFTAALVLAGARPCVKRGKTFGGASTVSDTDSFIDEVTEEVRRDRLFGLMKRYGWIAVVAVLLIVGGAAYNEISKARARASVSG